MITTIIYHQVSHYYFLHYLRTLCKESKSFKENLLYLFIFENYIEMTEIPHFFKISSSSWTSSLSMIYIYRMFIVNFLGESLGISGLVVWWYVYRQLPRQIIQLKLELSFNLVNKTWPSHLFPNDKTEQSTFYYKHQTHYWTLAWTSTI